MCGLCLGRLVGLRDQALQTEGQRRTTASADFWTRERSRLREPLAREAFSLLAPQGRVCVIQGELGNTASRPADLGRPTGVQVKQYRGVGKQRPLEIVVRATVIVTPAELRWNGGTPHPYDQQSKLSRGQKSVHAKITLEGQWVRQPGKPSAW